MSGKELFDKLSEDSQLSLVDAMTEMRCYKSWSAEEVRAVLDYVESEKLPY